MTSVQKCTLQMLQMPDSNPRKFGPLPADSWMVREPTTCPGCHQLFKAGEVVTLVAIGPGDDPEARQRASEGKPYNAIAIPAHYSCVTGDTT